MSALSPDFQPQHCLIVGPSWVGDMMMAQSLFMVLKRHYPGLLIDVLAPAWSLPLLAAMPEVHEGIEFPFGHGKLALWRRYRFARELRGRYDWSIVLPNSFKSALTPFWANIPVRTGYKGEQRYGVLNDRRLLDKQALPMTVERFVALADRANVLPPGAYSQPSLRVKDEQRTAVAQQFSIVGDVPLLVLCPGAEYGLAKQWPASYYAAVAQHGLQQDWQIVILGSQKDQAVAQSIVQHLPSPAVESVFNLAGKTSLHEAMVLLSMARYVISNDSGLMHLAAAVDVPVIAIYGSSDPNFTPPLSAKAVIEYLGLDCSPCFKRTCPLGHLNCLQQISPEQVTRHLV